MVGLVARSCFLCRNDSEFRLISKSELRWGRRALWALLLGQLVQLLKADQIVAHLFKWVHIWFISLSVQGKQKIHAGGSFYLLLYLKCLKQ